MDKSWMLLSDKCDPRFIKGIMDFVSFVKQNKPRSTMHKCPRKHCRLHHEKLSLDEIQTHLFSNGIMEDYTIWTYHGEESEASSSVYTQRRQHVMEKSRGSTIGEGDSYYMNPTIEMLNDAFPFHEEHEGLENDFLGKDAYEKYEKLLAEAQTPIYPGSDKTVLGTILSAMIVKVDNGWSDKSFNDHLKLTQELLPIPNHYPGSYREIKRILKNLGMGYEIIHACEYCCVLFYKNFKDLMSCPVCETTRYLHLEGNSKIPRKVVRYFPLAPRLQRLYILSPHIAKEMRWHGERKKKKGLIRHPADSEAWQNFDKEFPDFAKDVQNVRLGLATDGFNPFGAAALSHSTWPIVVMPYNLPPSLCIKKEFNILAMLISGPKSPGKCLNVFMQPLIYELNMLWDSGVLTFDRHDSSTFNMRAAVMWTISDFPGLGMLGGLKCKGYKACPMCLDEVDAQHLAGRMSYQGHRRWLDRDNSWRNASSKFNGQVELRDAPLSLTGEEIFSTVISHEYPILSLHPDFKPKGVKEKLCWTHVTVLYDLPYWATLRQPYSLDVMHIEKNVFDNIIGTILGLQGKTKDDIKAREGLEKQGIRKELWWKRKDSTSRKEKVSQAPYTVLPNERAEIFEFIKDAKYPYGYAGSLKNKINVVDKKFNGLKTHDCHVMLQRLLPVFIRPYLPHHVVEPLISLARWFQMLCCKELTVGDVTQMKDDIVIILCKLEMVFPPAFFTHHGASTNSSS